MTRISYMRLLAASLVIVLLALTGCKPREEAPALLSLDLPGESITFGQAGGTQEVAVLSTESDWTVDVTPALEKGGWLAVTRDKEILKITAAENTSGKELSATIAVTLGGLRRELKVRQQSGSTETISVEKSSWDIGSEGGEVTIPVTSSSPDWSYTLSESVDWLTVERGSDGTSLKVRATRSFDPNPREVYIALTLGESISLRIRQVGVRLFPDFLLEPGVTRQMVLEYATKVGLTEDTEEIEVTEYDDMGNLVKKKKTRKEATWTKDLFYRTEALKGVYLVYQFQNADKDKVFKVYIMSVDGAKYERSDVEGFLGSHGFIHGGKDFRGDEYWTKSDVETLRKYTVNVYYEYEPNRPLGRAYPKGARLEFALPAKINPEDIGSIMTEFPMDRLETFRDPAIKFEQVREYELSRGFRLMENTDYPYCKKSDVEGYTHLYEYVQFERADMSTAKEGDLISTQYSFLIPGMNNYGKDYNVGATKENAGAIGQRIDVYKGYKKFFDRHFMTGAWNLKPEVVAFAKQKGYELAHTDRGFQGWTYFTKGDDLIFIMPSEKSVQVAFFRNKETAETARHNKRPDNQ